jgi:hypothetical protein
MKQDELLVLKELILMTKSLMAAMKSDGWLLGEGRAIIMQDAENLLAKYGVK